MGFNSLLAEFKAQFEDWRGLVVLDEKPLRRYVMCWGPQMVRRVADYPQGDTLADLWDCVVVDYQALAEITGDSMPDVMGRFRQVQGMQLIYPDGTVSKGVSKILRGKLAEIKGFDG